MKKRLFIFLIVLCLLSISYPITVSAGDLQVYQGTGTCTMTFVEQSSYCILIPEYIDMNAGLYTFKAENINIADNEKVYVTVTNLDGNNRLLFTHESGEYTLTKNFEVFPSANHDTLPEYLPNNCVGYFSGDDKTSFINFRLGSESFDYSRIKAGMYSATVEFSVDLSG